MNPEIKVRTVKRYYVNGKGYNSLYAACHATATREEKAKLAKIIESRATALFLDENMMPTDDIDWVGDACVELYGHRRGYGSDENGECYPFVSEYDTNIWDRTRELMQAYKEEHD
jgi:hypothetical protein